MKTLELEITPDVQKILDVHNSLWDILSHSNVNFKTIEFNGIKYSVNVPNHLGFASVVLPGSNNKNFLWITQNMNKSTYGSLDIKESRSQGNDKRITWVVDNTNDKFHYCALIKTCLYFDGKIDILVEKYKNESTEIVYSTNPVYASYVTHKSKY